MNVRGLSIVMLTCVYISLNGFLTEKKSKSMSKTNASPFWRTWQIFLATSLTGHSSFLRELEDEHSALFRALAFCISLFFTLEELCSRSPGVTDEEAATVFAVSSVFSFSLLADITSPFSSWLFDVSVGLMRMTCKFKGFWFSSWSAGT